MFQLLTLLLVVTSPFMMVMGQQIGTMSAEVHPKLTWQKCASGGKCTDVHGAVVLDHNWRWIHDAEGKACFADNKWDAKACPDAVTCAKNCALDGANYQGITTSGNALHINTGSRLYLLANDSAKYEEFHLLNQEFTFDVDLSKLGCGLNGALYLVSMEADGGSAKHPNNKAGAKYGTGYCDAQCPKGARFIAGEAGMDGKHGECCPEMDIWEANAISSVYTLHPCTTNAYHLCEGSACGSTCESGGCGFNSYAEGDHAFYGPGKTVDTNKVFTVVTQFITSDNTAAGTLHELRRFYVQGGKVIPNSKSTTKMVNSITPEYCGSAGSFSTHGGIKGMGDALKPGMVLTFALWGEAGHGMEWLDQGNNGNCPTGTNLPSSSVIFSNIKIGALNSTFHHT